MTGIAGSAAIFGQATNTFPQSGNVGIGTASPSTKLQVTGGRSTFRASNEPYAIGVAYNDSQYVTDSFFLGATDNAGTQYRSQFQLSNAGGMPLLTATFGGNVGIGTTNPQSTLAVNGSITAKDVMVTSTGWSDYVFQPGYHLLPLREVHAYIQANHHLPDIPSETEVKEKGVSMGEMQAKLLAKIEELTLHMIQQEEENQELRDRIARLEKGAANATPAAAK